MEGMVRFSVHSGVTKKQLIQWLSDFNIDSFSKAEDKNGKPIIRLFYQGERIGTIFCASKEKYSMAKKCLDTAKSTENKKIKILMKMIMELK